MTYVGIAIFTVFFKSHVCRLEMPASPTSKCVPIVEEDGENRALYVGEFDSEKACYAVVGNARWKPEKGERVDALVESECVRKPDVNTESAP